MIRGDQRSSEVIGGHYYLEVRTCKRVLGQVLGTARLEDQGDSNLDRWQRGPRISAHQRPTVIINGHQWSSVVISGHQWSSVVISAHQCSSVLISAHQCSSVLISAHQCSSVLITGHYRSSQVIAGHQRQSEALKPTGTSDYTEARRRCRRRSQRDRTSRVARRPVRRGAAAWPDSR